MKQLIQDDSVKKDAMKGDKKYSRAIRIPQYEPSDKKPAIGELFDAEKYKKLMAHIKRADVSDEERQFLEFAATRHIKFNFAKIADYFAHSDKEVQGLFKESALVILDMDDAIANGYVKLSEKMKQLIQEEKERDKKAREADALLKRQRKVLGKRVKSKKLQEEIKEQTDNIGEGFMDLSELEKGEDE